MSHLLLALLKIPFLLSEGLYASKATTRPNLPATPTETQKYGGLDFAARTAHGLTTFHKIMLWISILCEVSVIIADTFPNPLVEPITSLLVRVPNSATRIRLTPAFLASWTVMITGALMRLWCQHKLGRLFRWELSIQEDHKLFTDGPYAVVRHPSYTSGYMMLIGTFACLLGPGSWWAECGPLSSRIGQAIALLWASWPIFTLPSICARVVEEDRVLKREFGEEWEAWATRTPYRLIPFCY